MSLLPDASLDHVLRSQNPWWVTGAGGTRGNAGYARAFDAQLLREDRSVLLSGPRRSGKSAALRRLVDARLREGTRPRDVAYCDLGHALLRLEPLGPLVDRLIKLLEPEGQPWVLLDGIQAVPEWPARLRELIDTRPQARFVAASAVADGQHDPSYDHVRVPPLRFREQCALRGLPELGAPPLDPVALELPRDPDSADDYLFDRVLEPLLADYLVRGGFPEAALPSDPAEGRAQVREEVVARAIYEDLPAVVHVMTQADLERVFLAVLMHGSAPLPVESFSDALGLTSQTLGRYLDHLDRCFLLNTLRNFAASTERSRPRLFPTDPALPNAFLDRGAEVLAQPVARRDLLLGAIVAHVSLYAQERGFDLAYFKDGDLEADIVLVTPEGALPILLFDREEVGEEEVARVDRLMKRMSVQRAIVLSRARPRRREAITFFESVDHLPASYFLYALASGV
ncbi:MAG: ATP-binding protein [Planctomycetota bacterium]